MKLDTSQTTLTESDSLLSPVQDGAVVDLWTNNRTGPVAEGRQPESAGFDFRTITTGPGCPNVGIEVVDFIRSVSSL